MIFDFGSYRKDTGFRFVTGCRAACEKKLREGFKARKNGFVANVSAEHIDPLLRAYVASQPEELFLFIETPCNLVDEELDADGNVQHPHVNVYYWDGITKDEAYAVLDEVGEWLIGDGMTQFGFGVKSFSSEIMKQRYNVISLYSKTPEREHALLAAHLQELPALRTAWEYFDQEHPGDCFRYERDGRTVHDVVAELQKRGLYLAGTREA